MAWIFPRIGSCHCGSDPASGKMQARACIFAPADGCTFLLKKRDRTDPIKDEIPERQICLVYDSQHPMGDVRTRERKKYNCIRRG